MKFKILCFMYFSYFSFLHAEVVSYSLENDAIFKTDKHLTNAFSYSWLSDKDTYNEEKYDSFLYDSINKVTLNNELPNQSIQFNFEHFIFTPEDIEIKEKIIDDLPYAGVALFGLSVYRWEENYFHKVGFDLSVIGPAAFGEEFQNGIHKIIGAKNAEGWDNQISNAVGVGVNYEYAEKHFKINFKNKHKIELTHKVRFDLGTVLRNFMIGSNLRYGYNTPDNFATMGKTLGENQNYSLNLDSKKEKGLGYSISYAIFYNYIDYFYVTDYDKSYDINPSHSIVGKILNLGLNYRDYSFTLSFKEEVFLSTNSSQKWGTLSIKKVF